MIDLEHQILPNVITLPGIAVGFALSVFLPPGPLMSLAGILVGGGLLCAIAESGSGCARSKGWASGDVKMLAMVGAFLGGKLVILTFVLVSDRRRRRQAAVAMRRGGMATQVPFGTLLAVAALIASLYGDRSWRGTWVVDAAMTRASFILLSLTAVVALVAAARVCRPAAGRGGTADGAAAGRPRRRDASWPPRWRKRSATCAQRAGDDGPSGSFGTAERRDHRQPHVGPAGRRRGPPRAQR